MNNGLLLLAKKVCHKFMFSPSLAQVPVKYVSVQCRGGLIMVLLYGIGKSLFYFDTLLGDVPIKVNSHQWAGNEQ